MKFWTAAYSVFPYTFDEVCTTFWDRYPNSYAGHIISEDVLERKITENTIITKKLIVKQGNSILKRMPRWLSRMTEIRTVPTIEESVYDRNTNTLTTYTRNVTHMELLQLHERCVYRPVPVTIDHPWMSPSTRILRSAYINVNSGKLSSLYENFILIGFKNSISRTTKGMTEKLEERFGSRPGTPSLDKHQLGNKIKEKIKGEMINLTKASA